MVGGNRFRCVIVKIAAVILIGIIRGCVGRSIISSRFEQRVLLYFGRHIGFDFEIGQRQQFDRLLQLRRHDQLLGLPQIEAGT